MATEQVGTRTSTFLASLSPVENIGVLWILSTLSWHDTLNHTVSVFRRTGLSAGLFSYSMTRSVKTEGCQASPGCAPGHFPVEPGLRLQSMVLWQVFNKRYFQKQRSASAGFLVPTTSPVLSPGRGGGKRCSHRGWLRDLVLGQDPALTATITATVWCAG